MHLRLCFTPCYQVVLKDDKGILRDIDWDWESTTNTETGKVNDTPWVRNVLIYIGNPSRYNTYTLGITLLKDNTAYVKKSHDYNSENTYIKYNNQNLKIKTIYYLSNESVPEDSKEIYNGNYYVISTDNYLYKIVIEVDKNMKLTNIKVEKVSEKKIKNSPKIASGYKNSEIENITFTFEDGKTQTISEIAEMYNI